jgi:hypothetical protein
MAERPPVQKETLTPDDLLALQKKLGTMSVTAVLDFYRAAYGRCRLDGDRVPTERAIQELVQAWKHIRRW